MAWTNTNDNHSVIKQGGALRKATNVEQNYITFIEAEIQFKWNKEIIEFLKLMLVTFLGIKSIVIAILQNNHKQMTTSKFTITHWFVVKSLDFRAECRGIR